MNGRIQQFVQVPSERGVGRSDSREIVGAHRARRHDETSSIDGRNGFLRGNVVRAQLIGIQPHYDGSLVASEWGRRGNSFEHREQRANPIQCDVLHFANASSGTGEDQLANGNAARIVADNERRHCSGWRKCPRAVHIADHLSHRLAHVRSGMKDQLH